MELKDVCCIIGLVVLAGGMFYHVSMIEDHVGAYIELEGRYNLLDSQIKYHNEELRRCYDRDFERDCLLRGYSSYHLWSNGGRFCCKWFNETRICHSWFDVVHSTPITINIQNFTTENNATILLESDYGDIERFTIILPNIDDKYFVSVYDSMGYVEVVVR